MTRTIINTVPYLTFNELRNASFNFIKPFRLMLIHGQELIAEKILRIVPGKRMVIAGRWKEKRIVAKLFVDPKQAKKHIDRELAGTRLLTENKIPTPLFYSQTLSLDKQIQILIFEEIQEAHNLEDIVSSEKEPANLFPTLKAVIIELATQHVLGVLQTDLHFKNFLITEKIIYTLDGAQVECTGKKIDQARSIDHLALFLSQLAVGTDALQKKLFETYAKARGWLLKAEHYLSLNFAIKKYHHQRFEKYAKKIFRECSDFSVWKKSTFSGMVDRRHNTGQFKQFLENPEASFKQENIVYLKDGRSATVIKVYLDGRAYVIKRYNIKNFLHQVRRLFRSTRACSAWRLGLKLKLFRIATANPVAYLEKRCLGLCTRSYFISEYVEGEDAKTLFEYARTDPVRLNQMITRMTDLLRSLAKLNMTHGDLKLSNILITEGDYPLFIDLDGALEHDSLSSLRRAWGREIKRLLANFNQHPQLKDQFQAALQ